MVPMRLISTATNSSLSSLHIRSTGPMSVGHSRRISRSPSGGASASNSCSSRSTPSFSSAAASPMSCVTSETTSAMRISMRSSAPFLRTTMSPSSSSITVGGVIQFCGLTLWPPPPSDHTMKVPSDFTIRRRTASGEWVDKRPE
jgi:hypothetical protein